MNSLSPEIGDLLIRANILTLEELGDAVKLADKMRQPISRVLEMNGYCSEKNLQDTDQIQTNIATGLINLEAGVKAVELVIRQGMDLETAIRRLTLAEEKPKSATPQNIVGDLLAATNVISRKQLSDALRQSQDTRLPLGVVLVAKEAIPATILESAITLLEYRTAGVLTEEQSTHALKLSRFKKLSAKDALLEQNPNFQAPPESFSVKDLLVAAGLINANQLLIIREMQLVQKQPFLKALSDSGFCSHLILDATLQTMQMIEENSLTRAQGLAILQQIKHVKSEEEMNEVLAHLEEQGGRGKEAPILDFRELILATGLIGVEELSLAETFALQSKKSLSRVLLEASILDEKTVELISSVQQLVKQRMLDLEQAKIVLLFSVENNAGLKDALDLFGW
jgi:hypothetical protein